MDLKKVLAFVTALDQNNNKEWMDANKKWYLEAKEEFVKLTEQLIKATSIFEPAVADLEAKKCVFRINRDIRFSNDKTPYKNNFGMAMGEGGRTAGNPIYYFHIEPGKSFVAGGLYMPEAEVLKKIRQEVDYNAGELKKLVEKPSFMKAFGGLQGEKLKTAPKGYPKDHPHLELLQFKSYVVSAELTDEELLAEGLADRVVGLFKEMKPLNDYLSVAIS
jgi:uncharacterized protein (TIGR02453 family)